MTDQLIPEHAAQLEASGISQELAVMCGWRSIDHVEAQEMGLGENSGLYIPYMDPTTEQYDFGRLRLDEERENGQKYTQKEGTGSRLYFPGVIHMHEPGVFRSMLRGNGKKVNVFIVEGEKKAFALQQRLGARGLVLGLGGCWNWTKKRTDFDQGSRELIDDFKHVEFRDRNVYICFDSDVATNPNVAKAERELAHAIRGCGAKQVRLITLFPGRKGEKVGLDDFLVECGSDWEEEFRKICWKSQLKERVILPRILSYEEMLETRFKPIKVILGHREFPLLNSGGLCYIHSMSGVGKTYFSMQMAHALATGSKFLGEYPTDGQLNVVFLQAELSDGWFQRRLRKLNQYYGPAHNLKIMNGQMTLGKGGKYGEYDINLTPLEQIIVTQRADVVFIDPLQGYTDIPENNTDANREFQRQLSKLRHKYECAVVVTHHDRKSGDGEGMHKMRGSTVLSDWADVVVSLMREVRIEKDPDTNEKKKVLTPGVITLTYDKVRHAEGERPACDRLRRCLNDGYQTPWLEMHPMQQVNE